MAHEGHDHDHDQADHHAHEESESTSSFLAPPAMGQGLEGCARVLHVDPVGGAAGDMLIAAFLDLGVPRAVIEEAVAETGLTDYRLDFSRRTKHAIVAAGFDVIVSGEQPPRDYAAISALLASKLEGRARELAERVFLRLAEAEAKIHRQPIARVHFHEVGGVDAIVDVVGSCAALAHLEENGGKLGISIGALPIGSGIGRSAHGAIPLPAPATLELMIGLPVRDPGFVGETVTPTGAALLRGFAEMLPSQLGRAPSMTPRAIGYGAGTKDFADRANVVRLILGELETHPRATTHVVLEANVDDVTGEVAAAAIEALFEAGALDAWAQPITMKKGRPAMTVAALAREEEADGVARALLAHTGSLGVRRSAVSRDERPRRFIDVSTAYGIVRVKIADGDGLPVVVHPELEVCRERAREHRVPVREVIRAAIAGASV